MSAGKFNRRITLQQPATGQDEAGQPVAGYADVCTVWAHIRHPSGSESLKADAQASTTKASIRIRYRADITSAMRVLHGTTVYSIQSVQPDEVRREHVDLVCEARA